MKKLKIYTHEMEDLPPFQYLNMDEHKKITRNSGYAYLKCPTHPFADYHGYIAEHRAVVEQYLGRYLTRSEIVHHIDHDKQNNDLENLWLFPDQMTHLRVGHSPLQKKELVEEVLAAAKDRNINFSDLSCSKGTARRILSSLEVEWFPGDEIGYTEADVIDALRKSDGSLVSAATRLKTSTATLRLRFPHLVPISDTKPAYYADEMKPEILEDYYSGMTIGNIVKKYEIQRRTLEGAFHRWGIPSGDNRNTNKRKLSGKLDDFLADYANGLTRIADLAKKYEVSEATARDYLQREGVYKLRRNPQGFLNPHTAEILELHAGGMRYEDIATRFGTTRATLQKHLQLIRLNGQRTESVTQ
jgi:transposase